MRGEDSLANCLARVVLSHRLFMDCPPEMPFLNSLSLEGDFVFTGGLPTGPAEANRMWYKYRCCGFVFSSPQKGGDKMPESSRAVQETTQR